MKKAVSHRCVDPGQRIREKHKMRCISAFFLAVGMALLLFVCAGVWQGKNYLLAGILMLLFLFGVVVLNFEKRKPRAREIALLSTMTGLSVAANELCSHTIPLHAGTAMVVISGIALGPETGFFVGALARFVCNFFSGQGPWTPWQMLGFGLVGFLGGVLFAGRKVRLVPLLLYGFFSVLIVYGVLLDTASMLMYNAVPSWQLWLATCASGFVFNLIHAGATAVFLLLLYQPLLRKLARVKEKYGLLE